MKNNTQPALKERIEKALEDFTKGRASMHVPPLDTDVDVVLAECSDRLSELKARCAALAAENAGMKSVIEYCINPDNQPEYHDQGMGCGVEDHGYQRDGYSACYYGWESAMELVYSEVIPDAIPETPATDAFLAEVRAQGVEMAVDVVKQCYDNICAGGLQENREYEESIVQPHLDGIDDELNEIIAQLRKGVQS
ncbi:hypothetical protein [Enterobacter kobei]|uniref:hypothetical protein n=1 Tax=Enterobacter kobei TaxID=208224 RepID=UPI000AE53D3A|nr:hypothetical protein [Enterobacter kobei]